MDNDNSKVWDRLQKHSEDIEQLKETTATHKARIDATESRTDQMMREMAEMRGESRQHHSDMSSKVANLQVSVQQGIGALRFGGYLTATIVGIGTIAATLAAYFLH